MKSLRAINSKWSDPEVQVRFLEREGAHEHIPFFHSKLQDHGIGLLKTDRPSILQVNIGYQCNQTCKHCHVDAGPDRKEKMSEEIMEDCIRALETGCFEMLDITGGAPEMHSGFRRFVAFAASTPVAEIVVRSNLTILMANPVYADLPEFFKMYGVRVCSSLPFYSSTKTDRQRGEGVFMKSIKALKMLNAVGYGMGVDGLRLDLVYNPSGAFCAAPQDQLEKEFKSVLEKDYGIYFDRLLTINNVPVSRFLDFLIESGNFEDYLDKLVQNFNPATLAGLMCRNTVSVDWQGRLFDCDFNQMLQLPKQVEGMDHIRNFSKEKFRDKKIITGRHCFACTAGLGSSCQGAVV